MSEQQQAERVCIHWGHFAQWECDVIQRRTVHDPCMERKISWSLSLAYTGYQEITGNPTKIRKHSPSSNATMYRILNIFSVQTVKFRVAFGTEAKLIDIHQNTTFRQDFLLRGRVWLAIVVNSTGKMYMYVFHVKCSIRLLLTELFKPFLFRIRLLHSVCGLFSRDKTIKFLNQVWLELVYIFGF